MSHQPLHGSSPDQVALVVAATGEAIAEGLGPWVMWAGVEPEETRHPTRPNALPMPEFAYVFPDRRHPEAYGYDETTTVEVTLDVEGDYFGWLPNPERGLTGNNDYPCFIWGGLPMLTMCFTYGGWSEMRSGKGRIVRLGLDRTDVQPESGR